MADEETTSPVQESAAETPAAEAGSTADAALASAAAEAPGDATSQAGDANAAPAAEAAPAGETAAEANGSLIAELEAATQLAAQMAQEAPPVHSHRKTEDAAAAPPESPVFTLGPAVPVSDEIRRILRLEVPVIVKLADKRLSLGDIIDLSPGSIVEFTKSAEQSLELMVNNKIVGRGVAVKVGEKFGLRIDEILPVSQTIRSLGN